MGSLYLRVRDHAGGKQSVGVAADSALDAADGYGNGLIFALNAAFVVTMYGETCFVPAGTAHLLKLNLLQNGIINLL